MFSLSGAEHNASHTLVASRRFHGTLFVLSYSVQPRVLVAKSLQDDVVG